MLAVLAGCSDQATGPVTNIASSTENPVPTTASSSAGPDEPCAITGESTDGDLAGLRVHSEPRLDSPEIGRLYPGADPESFFHDDGEGELGLVGAQFTIDRVDGQWLHITDIDPISDGIDPQGRTESTLNFTGTGWVHSSKVRLIFTNVAAHEAPDGNAPIVAEARFSNGEEARLLLGCRGRWAHLEYEPREGEANPGRRVTAWVLSESNRAHAEIMRQALERERAAR